MHGDNRFSALTALTCLLSAAHAFYIPGWSIKSFRPTEPIPLFYNKIYSDQTQLQYAYAELPFVCPPAGRRHASFTSGTSITLNLGEVLRGDRIVVSDYELAMGEDQELRYLCSRTIDAEGLQTARDLVREKYVVEWIVDNLPGATSFVTTDKSRKYYAAGFKLGYEDVDLHTGTSRLFLNNHVTLVLRHRRAPGRDGERGKRVIVGFEVYPKSIETGNRNATTGLPFDLEHVDDGFELELPANVTAPDETARSLTIPYTYSVYFREDDKVEWGNRWDMYFVDQEDNQNIHWLAIFNSLVICGLLTAVVAVIFARTIRGDIIGYKEGGLEEGRKKALPKKSRKVRSALPSPSLGSDKGSSGLLEKLDDADADLSSDDEVEDVTGWKLVHGDVFRPPAHGTLLAPLVGCGTQLVFMAAGLILLSCIGVLNPSFRGGFVSVGAALFVFAGVFSGYFSARVFRTFGGQNWRRNVVVTGTLVPGLLFATIFILNLFVWAHASSTAIPFGTLVGIVALWLAVQLPLVYVGSWYGYTMVGAWEHPVKASPVPRAVPVGGWLRGGRVQTVLIAGLVPFAVIFIELLFVFKSLWLDKSGYYYVFGFLAVVSSILIVTVVEVTVVATYLQLCSENYHWWWQSFFVGGGSAVWIFAYTAWYYATRLHIVGFANGLLFFAYSFLACLVYGLLTGTIGFLAAYAFVRRIYA
ncbi:putative multispanning membrane protein [Trichodelitschia bisporula]|uniref:Transmembrane 9 superfamily member n=1 Tax=Trichodelitschia bisporula TaxID=703511 RepID=A0A6G1I004_9PEZI|nr:putative multispanning membrane protein [Trichodelitschia bisporula]